MSEDNANYIRINLFIDVSDNLKYVITYVILHSIN